MIDEITELLCKEMKKYLMTGGIFAAFFVLRHGDGFYTNHLFWIHIAAIGVSVERIRCSSEESTEQCNGAAVRI